MTEDDKTLLTKAAKAAGIDLKWTKTVYGSDWPVYYFGPGCVGETAWIPLDNDGDALRLAVALHIDIYTEDDDGRVGTLSRDCEEFWEPATPDPSAAIRRCIVRAAAHNA